MNKAIKYVGIGVGGLVGLLLLTVGGVYAASSSRMSKTFDVPNEQLESLVGNPEAIAAGEHNVASFTKCVDCHGEDLAGKLVIPGGPIGTIGGPNLTSGGTVIGKYADVNDFENLVRHCVRPDGTTIRFMPCAEYNPLSDLEISQIHAYVLSKHAVTKENPPVTAGPLGRILYLAGKMPMMNSAEVIDHSKAHIATPPPTAATKEFGAHMALGCSGCHRPNYEGGPIPGGDPSWAPAANLSNGPDGIGSWTEADFTKALREGVRPDGTAIREPMPIAATKRMTDEEISAVWLFLRDQPAVSDGK